MLNLSNQSKRLVSIFYSYRNEIDIYTEDEEKDKEFYKSLFKKLLNDSVIINDVTPLGCKANVIERCRNEPKNGRKKIFIVDGDAKLINNTNEVLENLYVLDAYCIENMLITRDSIIDYIYIKCATKARDIIINELRFEEWINEFKDLFIDLFLHFAIIDLYGGRFEMFNANKYHSIKNKILKFDKALLVSEIGNLQNQISQLITPEEYNYTFDALSKQWGYSIDTFFTIVSGKTFLIPLLTFKTIEFQSVKNIPPLPELKMLLLDKSDLSRLQGLKNTIESL